jgi:phosphoenolpyruvate carboxylase
MTIPTPDKDQPLFDDIRLLGRMLGDTLREQEGSRMFELIENVRQLCVRFRRDDDLAARAELAQLLNSLTDDDTIIVVRAFSYFLHLANIAEDQHHIRRARAHAIAGDPSRGRGRWPAPCRRRSTPMSRQTRYSVSSGTRWWCRC